MIFKKTENIHSEIEFLPIKTDGQKFYVELHHDIANGFPSPAEDFSGIRISLDERFLTKPEATFVGRAIGQSNYPFIMHGDYMIIRTDLDPKDGELAVFYISGEGFSVKKIDMENNCLVPLNKDFPKIPVGPDEVVETKGVIKAIFREIESLDF